MSAKRKKRISKANSPSVRGVQDGPPALGMQQDNQPVPQPEGESLAETDTKNTKQQGGNKVNGSFMDRIREHKGIIIQHVVIVAIAVVVSAIMILQLATSKGAYDATILGLEGDIARAGASINTLGTTLNTRMDSVEAIADNATGTVSIISVATTENSNAIEILRGWTEGAEIRITTVEAHNSPPEGYLTGNFSGNYTLHAKCSEAGNFTANVHLVYSPPISVGNATTQDEALQAFYGSINWTAPTVRDYVCTLTYNSTAWQVSQVWFNIGTFAMTANNETAIDIIFSGLGSAYNATFAYIEVWSILNG